MTLLQILFIISSFITLLIGIDIIKRKKFNFLHALILIGIAVCLSIFTLYPSVLNKFGKIFGVQRGAYVLVYLSIIFLFYFSLFLFTKSEKNKEDITKLIREISLLEFKVKNENFKK